MSNDSTKIDEDALFRSEMGDVTPLKPSNRVENKVTTEKKQRVTSTNANDAISDNDYGLTDGISDTFSDADYYNDYDNECPEILNFARSGLQHNVLKKLRQGKNPIGHTLDLHGLTIDQARAELIAFLNECESANIQHALIVHGKGFGSNGKPVIKPMINRWLPQVANVLAFHSAQAKDGGNGAVYVLLKRVKHE